MLYYTVQVFDTSCFMLHLKHLKCFLSLVTVNEHSCYGKIYSLAIVAIAKSCKNNVLFLVLCYLMCTSEKITGFVDEIWPFPYYTQHFAAVVAVNGHTYYVEIDSLGIGTTVTSYQSIVIWSCLLLYMLSQNRWHDVLLKFGQNLR